MEILLNSQFQSQLLHCMCYEMGIFFFFVFLPFLGLLLWHMDVPRLGVESEL